MPEDSFDRAEESRERNEGFAYVDYHERMSARDDEDAYDLSDPKHPRHHEVYAEISDSKEATE